MFIRYWHTFVRFSGFFIIPLIIFPIIATLILFSSNSYQAGASFWVQESPYLSVSQVSDGSNFDSPSTTVGGLLNELLSTRDFLNTIIDNSPLKNKVKTEADRETMGGTINKNLKIDTTGYRLVQLSYSDKDPVTALQVLTLIVNNFKSYYDNRVAQQTQSAVSFYTDLLKKDQSAVDTAKAAVDSFLQNHPDVATSIASQATTPDDLEYQGLSNDYDKARQQYTTDQESLQKVQTDYQAFLKGGGTTLAIQDTPKVFDANSSKSRQIELGVGIGVAITAVLALIFTIVKTLLDGSMRETGYAQRVLRLERVIELPAIKPAKSWYNDLETQHEAKLANQKLLPSPDTTTPKKKKKTKAGARLRQILAWQIRTY